MTGDELEYGPLRDPFQERRLDVSCSLDLSVPFGSVVYPMGPEKRNTSESGNTRGVIYHSTEDVISETSFTSPKTVNSDTLIRNSSLR